MKRPITLEELRVHADTALAGLWLLRRGNRLSVMPVDAAHWEFILGLE
jgi:predicted RNA-binding protein with PUA-like domain